MLALHQAALAESPADGEDYFKFPKLSEKLLAAHQRLSLRDVAGLAELWIHSNLKQIIEKGFSSRAIGSFMLGLAQVNCVQLVSALDKNLPQKGDPEIITKLTRMNEFSRLVPIGLNLHEKREALGIEDRMDKRSAITLFGYGIITRDLSRTFNHRLIDILHNEFAPEQIPALTAALKYPKIVDPFMGANINSYYLRIALTGALRRINLTQET